MMVNDTVPSSCTNVDAPTQPSTSAASFPLEPPSPPYGLAPSDAPIAPLASRCSLVNHAPTHLLHQRPRPHPTINSRSEFPLESPSHPYSLHRPTPRPPPIASPRPPPTLPAALPPRQSTSPEPSPNPLSRLTPRPLSPTPALPSRRHTVHPARPRIRLPLASPRAPPPLLSTAHTHPPRRGRGGTSIPP